VISNVVTTYLDRTTKTFLAGLSVIQGPPVVLVYSYTNSSLHLTRTCNLTGFTEIGCVAGISGDVYVVASTGSLSTILKLNITSCSTTALSEFSGNVKGSTNGPGGVCALLPQQSSIYFFLDPFYTPGNSTFAAFNYVSLNYTTQVFYNPDFLQLQFVFRGNPTENYMIYRYIYPNSVLYKITTGPLAFTSIGTISTLGGGLTFDASVPANLVDSSSYNQAVYSNGATLLSQLVHSPSPACPNSTNFYSFTNPYLDSVLLNLNLPGSSAMTNTIPPTGPPPSGSMNHNVGHQMQVGFLLILLCWCLL